MYVNQIYPLTQKCTYLFEWEGAEERWCRAPLPNKSKLKKKKYLPTYYTIIPLAHLATIQGRRRSSTSVCGWGGGQFGPKVGGPNGAELCLKAYSSFLFRVKSGEGRNDTPPPTHTHTHTWVWGMAPVRPPVSYTPTIIWTDVPTSLLTSSLRSASVGPRVGGPGVFDRAGGWASSVMFSPPAINII